MTEGQRHRLELLMRSLTGLELFATGELDAPKTVENDFLRLKARMAVYEALLFHVKPYEELDG